VTPKGSARGTARITIDRHIVSELMRELVGDGRQPSAFLVYLALAAQVAGQRRRKVTASYQTLADETGLSRSAAQAAVQKLLERGLLRAERGAATAAPTYVVERPWLDRD
jgi:DNA-binding Lrp family transcriptional regulator